MALNLPQVQWYLSEVTIHLSSGVFGLRRSKSKTRTSTETRASTARAKDMRRTESEPMTTVAAQRKTGFSHRRVKSDLEVKAKVHVTKIFNFDQSHTNYKHEISREIQSKEKDEREGRKPKRSTSKETRKERSLSSIRMSVGEKIQLFQESRGVVSDRVTADMDWKTRKEVRMMEAETQKIFLQMCKQKDEEMEKAQVLARKDSGV